jgi:hypothetical protein
MVERSAEGCAEWIGVVEGSEAAALRAGTGPLGGVAEDRRRSVLTGWSEGREPLRDGVRGIRLVSTIRAAIVNTPTRWIKSSFSEQLIGENLRCLGMNRGASKGEVLSFRSQNGIPA